MSDSSQCFIDLATRLLAEDEAAKEVAQVDLMNRLTHSTPPAGADTVEMAIVRLQETRSSCKRRAWGLFVAVALLTLAVALAFRSGLREYSRLSSVFNLPIWPIKNHKPYQDAWLDRLSAKVPADERLFVFSNTYGPLTDEAKRWFEESKVHPPEDPGWFEEFYLMANRDAPTRELAAHARRIDPDNGLRLTRETDPLIRELLHNHTLGSSGRAPSDPAYPITISLLEKASNSPRYESYIPARQAERLRLIGPAEDIGAISDRLAFSMTSQGPWGGTLGDREILQTRASELSSRGNTEGLREWIATGDRLTRKSLGIQARNDTFYLRPSTADAVQRHATKLGLTAEVALLQRWMVEVQRVRVGLLSGPPIRNRVPTSANPRGYWMGHVIPESVVTLAELEPGLRAEHALGDRFTALLLAGIFMGLALLALLGRWHRSRSLRGLTRGLMPLLRPVDYLWLAGLGLALPLAWYAAWMRLTPLGCRDFNIFLGGGIPFLVRGGTLLLLLLCMLLLTARWHLAKRGGFISLSPVVHKLEWAVAVYAALLVPLSGMIRHWPDAKLQPILMACSALGLPLLWLLWQFGAMAFRPRDAALGGMVLRRFLLPVLLATSATLLATMPLLKSEERRSIARDTISGPDPAGSQHTVLGARQDKLFRDRLLEAMK